MEYKENAHGVYVLDGNGNVIGDSDNPQNVTMDREQDTVEVTISVTSGGTLRCLSEAFSMVDKSAFGVQLPAGMTVCAIGVHVSATQNGAYQPLYDEDTPGAPHQIGDGTTNLSGKSWTFPAEVFPWPWVKLWSQNGSGTNVAQAANRLVTVVRKS